MTRWPRSRPREVPTPEVRAALERRASRVGARPPVAAEESPVWVAELAVAGERHAIPLERLRGCLPLRLVVPVPLAPPDVVGILRYQGRIVTALSLAAMLGIKGWSQDPRYLIVVDPGDQNLVALDCEEIPRPIALPERLADRVLDLAALLAARAKGRRE